MKSMKMKSQWKYKFTLCEVNFNNLKDLVQENIDCNS